MKITIKIILTILTVIISFFIGVYGTLILAFAGFSVLAGILGAFFISGLCIPLIWVKKRKTIISIGLITAIIYGMIVGIPYLIKKHEKSLIVDTSPNIVVEEYLPFDENSKIVQYKSETLRLTDNLPIIDGAAAVFPVYSAFVNATYPETTQFADGIFEYNNTVKGYELLAKKETDIFFGAYPSKEQIAFAEENNTTFKYTQIGSEGFVFFVHKNNPIDNLTTEQIQGIYSGKITNWKEVGGKNEEIVAYQRNEGSGSQSMLKRFMGDIPIAEPPIEQVNDMMAGIIEEVADYKNKTNSIGFSFRYYVEGIIQNPDIKIVSVDGVYPNVDNIKNGSYAITTPLYAVSTENEENDNVQKLIDWILTEEGQYIIEKTGYVGIN